MDGARVFRLHSGGDGAGGEIPVFGISRIKDRSGLSAPVAVSGYRLHTWHLLLDEILLFSYNITTMAQLLRDIEALFDTAQNMGGIDLGHIETAKGDTCALTPGRESTIKSMLADIDEGSRIAIVYLRQVQNGLFKGAWAAAAQEFCDEKMAAILVIDGEALFESFMFARPLEVASRGSEWESNTLDVERKMFSAFPGFFKDAGLPVLFDESGIFCDVIETSYILDRDPHLSFPALYDIDEDHLATYGNWHGECHFPVYDATGTDLEYAAARCVAEGLRVKDEFFCSDILNWNFGKAEDDLMSFLESTRFINDLFGDIVNIEDLTCIGNDNRAWEQPYAVYLQPGTNEGLEKVARQCHLMRDICWLLEEAFAKEHLKKQFRYLKDRGEVPRARNCPSDESLERRRAI